MQPSVVVFPVLSTVLNTSDVIRACREMNLGNPAEAADKKNLTGLRHLFEVLDGLQISPYLSKNVVNLGYMFVAWPDDLSDILTFTCGMSHFRVRGTERFQAAVVAGSISDWTRACELACHRDSSHPVRYAFNRVYRDMEKKLPNATMRKGTDDYGDGTFLLEHK